MRAGGEVLGGGLAADAGQAFIVSQKGTMLAP